jgi:uncharacterized MnhB-related membrane protein
MNMNLIMCVFFGILLLFVSGLMLSKKDLLWSLIAMISGVFSIVAAIGIASGNT